MFLETISWNLLTRLGCCFNSPKMFTQHIGNRLDSITADGTVGKSLLREYDENKLLWIPWTFTASGSSSQINPSDPPSRILSRNKVNEIISLDYLFNDPLWSLLLGLQSVMRADPTPPRLTLAFPHTFHTIEPRPHTCSPFWIRRSFS